MTILDGGDDQELLRLWALIAELSEELNQNRTLAVSLYSQANNVKNQSIHSQTGFVLRRFNLDKTQEAYDAELERMTSSMAAENLGLQHYNKQLNSMIKEYEQTLETLMSAFRTRAHDVQEHELSLIREYEAQLIAREEEDATHELGSSTAISQSLARLSRSLRQFMRSVGGEDQIHEPSSPQSPGEQSQEEEASNSEWALERECELARLEKENEILKRMLSASRGLLGDEQREQGRLQMQRSDTSNTTGHVRTISNQSEEVGPFGTYKRRPGV